MAFDACMMRAVLSEFKGQFPEAKIEKVLQPRNDEIDLVIHYGKASRRLIFNVGPNAPRLQLSDIAKENPPKPPMLCMFLRKHLTGGRIISVSQPDFDRIAIFTVSCYDDMGYPTEKKLVCEIMGKYANFIILDCENKVLNALKIIDFAASTVRQVLPGLKYQQPTKPEKLNPLVISREAFDSAFSSFDKSRTVEKFITQTYSGIATQIAREIATRLTGRCDTPLYEVDGEEFFSVFSSWQSLLINEQYTPTVVFDKSGKPIDYSYMDITYLGTELEKRTYPTFAEMFDAYFAEKDRQERIHQRAHDLIVLLNNAIARTERKLQIQRDSLKDSEAAEEYKKTADLITANLYRLKRGMTKFTAIDYYSEGTPEVEIELDSRLDAPKYAQKLYKKYNKLKTAREVLSVQIGIWERELLYLESVRAFLERAETEGDLNDIRDELFHNGYAVKLNGYRPQKKQKIRPMEFMTSGGFKLLVGRNNVQNDELTFRIAQKGDVWFHVKDLPGSHVILVTDGREPSEQDYTEAAECAAYYSKATGDLVAVDYTRVKNIKKPSGAKSGFVIYKTNYTAYVKPSKPTEENNG